MLLVLSTSHKPAVLGSPSTEIVATCRQSGLKATCSASAGCHIMGTYRRMVGCLMAWLSGSAFSVMVLERSK